MVAKDYQSPLDCYLTCKNVQLWVPSQGQCLSASGVQFKAPPEPLAKCALIPTAVVPGGSINTISRRCRAQTVCYMCCPKHMSVLGFQVG